MMIGPNACVSFHGQNFFFRSASEEDKRDFMAPNVAWVDNYQKKLVVFSRKINSGHKITVNVL